MALTVAGGGQTSQDGYSYLCRLEEIRVWMASIISEDIPKATDLEARLMNGVLLVKLGKVLLPDFKMWNKAYDLDEKKYLTNGKPDFRHTDNINFWLESLKLLGLPDVFYPQTTDIFEAKNMPKLVFCLHALSHYCSCQGKVETAVPNLEGRAKFTEEEITVASESMANSQVPSFNAISDLVVEEMQYQAMDAFVTPAQLDQMRKEHIANRERRAQQENIYDQVPKDDDKPVPPVPAHGSSAADAAMADVASDYSTSDDMNRQLAAKQEQEDEEDERPPLPAREPEASIVEVECGEGIKASLYSAVDKEALKKAREAALSPQEQAIEAINKAVTEKDPVALMKALKHPDADLPDVFSEPGEYMKDLIVEKISTFPADVTPVYTGIDRQKSEELLSSLSPGAILVRTGTNASETVVSFRNRTGIKHWKIGVTPDGKYYFGASARFDNIGDFMQQFMTSISGSTGLHTYYAHDHMLKPKAPDQEGIYGTGSEASAHLEREYIERVVAQVNKRIRSKLIGMMSDAPGEGGFAKPPAREDISEAPKVPNKPRPTSVSKAAWEPSLLSKVSRDQAEQVLMKFGQSGNYLVRISERGAGQYSISFRLHDELRHWRVVEEHGKFHIPPNSPKTETLAELVAVFQKIEHAPGVTMSPLRPKESAPSMPPTATSAPAVPPVATVSPPPLPPDSPTLTRAASVSGPAPPARNLPPAPSGVGENRPRLQRAMSVKSSGGLSVSEWSTDEVCHWMMGVGLGMHIATFTENAIDGPCLLELSDAQLKNDLGITALGHRNQILRKIKALNVGQ